ncbi:GSCOCG00000338001-RA-CDS, partial [Cotesia congregata]
MANITRIECFYLKLCRNYFANYMNIDNDIIKNLYCPSDNISIEHCATGYIMPEIFTFCDNRGLLQNENNLPIIYHENRHCKNKTLKVDHQSYNNFVFSTALPPVDIKDRNRLSECY